MKQKIVMLILTLTVLLGLAPSCTETFAPSVDFGERSYVNDYSSLVAQIRNLVDKIDILNKMASDHNFSGISIAIDKNTQAILAQTQALNDQSGKMSSDMKDILDVLLNGFTSISQTIGKTGEGIIYAIDNNGDVIKLALDENGNLISAAIAANARLIVEAINNGQSDIASRIDALNEAITIGLAEISVSSRSVVGDQLIALIKDLCAAVEKLDKTIFDGYNVINDGIDLLGRRVVYAINTNGDILRLSLDEFGKVTVTAIEGQTDALVKVINSATAPIADRISSLSVLIQSGLADINLNLGRAGEGLDVTVKGLNDAIKSLGLAVIEGFRILNVTELQNGESIVTAINSNGDKIKMGVDQLGTILYIGMDGLIDSINDLIAALEETSRSFMDKMSLLNEAINEGFEGISIAVSDATGELSLKIGDVNSTLFDGFKSIKKAVNTNGDNIVYAIDNQGKLIETLFDKAGCAISCKFEGLVSDLVAAINGQTAELATMGERINALNSIMESGLAKISCKIGDIGDRLDLRFESLNDAVGDLSLSLFYGFETLGTTIDDNGDNIVEAIDKLGNKIILEINRSGELISVKLDGIIGTLEDLIKILESSGKSLETKFEALNDAIAKGMEGVELSINKLTDNMTLKVGDVNSTLLDGFKALGDIVEVEGDKIVYAIGQEGEIISFQIAANGALIKAAIEGQARDIVDAINSQASGLGDKIAALDKAVSVGLARVEVKLGDVGGMLDVKLSDLNDSVKGIKSGIESLLDGLQAISQSVDGNNDKIVEAINAAGEKLTLTIDNNGYLISIKLQGIADELEKLRALLESKDSGLGDKIDALNTAIQNGMEGIKGAIDLNMLGIRVTLGELESSVFDGFKLLTDKQDELGNTIAAAINDNGEILRVQIKESGELIGASLDDNATALINALKDQNTSLETKLDDLGKLIGEGLAEIKVELGNLYQELKVDLGGLGDIIKEGFKGVTDGLTELKSEMNADGTAIVNAITGKGDLIQGQIDASGKLIEAAIKGNATDIKTALEALGTSSQAVADKVDALNTTVGTGLGNIEAKIDAQTGKIEAGYTDLSGQLGTIGTNILNGFNGTHTDLDAIKAAINGLKDQLTIDINANTEAILTLDADFKDQLGKLVTAVEKIGGDIVVAINGQKEAIVLALGPDGSIVGAINAGAAEIVDAIGAQTTSLSALLNTGNDTLADILSALGTSGKDIADILAYMKEHEVDLSEIVKLLGINNDLLTEILAISDGIYLTKDDFDESRGLYRKIYMTNEAYAAAQLSSKTDEAIKAMLVKYQMDMPSKIQYCLPKNATSKDYKATIAEQKYSTTDAKVHQHSFWKRLSTGVPELTSVREVTDKDNKTLVEVIYGLEKEVWAVKIHQVCDFRHIFGIKIFDAKCSGSDTSDADYRLIYQNRQANLSGNTAEYNGGDNPIVVVFTCYDKETGKFVEQPKAQIYCVITGGGIGSGGIDTVPEDDNIWLDDDTLFNLRDVVLTNGYNSITKDGKHDFVTE